jgi:hypothetical protein
LDKTEKKCKKIFTIRRAVAPITLSNKKEKTMQTNVSSKKKKKSRTTENAGKELPWDQHKY